MNDKLTDDEVKSLREMSRWYTAGKLSAFIITGVVSGGWFIIQVFDYVRAHWK